MHTETQAPMKPRGLKVVSVRTQFEALHQWVGAVEPVGFLANPHRHIFVVSVSVVAGGNRAVEFFCLKAEVDEWIKALFLSDTPIAGVTPAIHHSFIRPLPIIGLACEDMAELIANRLLERGYLVASVVVSEDNENAGTYIVSGWDK